MAGEKHNHADWPHSKFGVTHLSWVLMLPHFHKYWAYFLGNPTLRYYRSLINFGLFGFGLQRSVKIHYRFPLLFKSL